MDEATDRERLRRYCARFAKEGSLVFEVFEHLGPFFKIANNGPYPLRPQGDYDPRAMADAIASAVLRPVKTVRFISVAKAIDDAERESGSRERNGLWYAFERLLWDALWARSNVTLWGPLKRPIMRRSRMSVGDGLCTVMQRSLNGPLGERVAETLRIAGFGPHLCESIPKNLCQALFYFAGFAVGGSSQRVKEMIPLVERLPGCIPIGEMRRKPAAVVSEPVITGRRARDAANVIRDDGNGEWLVLVA